MSEGRESELGLVVVDEVHMLAEGDRGANLESLLVKVQYVSQVRGHEIQMVAMSATVGNLQQVILSSDWSIIIILSSHWSVGNFPQSRSVH